MSDVKVNDGGPAFPVNGPNGDHPGMTLRDYFAAKAMQAMLSCYKDTLLGNRADGNDYDYSTFNREMSIDKNRQTSENEGCKEIAQDAYTFADAMLKARHP